MTDKFFHGVQWDSKYERLRLDALNKILQDGQILSKYDQTNGKENSYMDKKIFLSVYPNGVYAKEFSGCIELPTYSAFDMTRSNFYFILNKKIKDDFIVAPGNYPLECLIEDHIPLKKYLIGVGNAGYGIDRKLIFCYWYTMFLKGKITQVELYKKIKEEFFPYLLTEEEVASHIESTTNWYNAYAGDTYYNQYIAYSLSKNENDLIYKGSYDIVKQIFANHEIPIKFYDNSGYRVEPEEQITKVLKMKRYIKDNATYIKNSK